MIKIKNTNRYPTVISCNGVQITLDPKMVIEVSEIVLGTLPEGVEVYKEMLTEIDPYTDKDIKENNIDVTQLLTETI